jgi:hypothetical protein
MDGAGGATGHRPPFSFAGGQNTTAPHSPVIPAKAGIQTRYRRTSGREVRGYGFPPARE